MRRLRERSERVCAEFKGPVHQPYRLRIVGEFGGPGCVVIAGTTFVSFARRADAAEYLEAFPFNLVSAIDPYTVVCYEFPRMVLGNPVKYFEEFGSIAMIETYGQTVTVTYVSTASQLACLRYSPPGLCVSVNYVADQDIHVPKPWSPARLVY